MDEAGLLMATLPRTLAVIDDGSFQDMHGEEGSHDDARIGDRCTADI